MNILQKEINATAGSAESNAWGDENQFLPMNQESLASKAVWPDAPQLAAIGSFTFRIF